MQTSADYRAVCGRCFKAAVVCICGDLPKVPNQTGVFILQHERERNHPIGTVRFAELALARFGRCTIGPKRAADRGRLDRWLAQLPPNTALLYPGPNATVLRPDSGVANVLLLDGTWHHAKTLYVASPRLAALPQVVIEPARPSAYKIRREPKRAYVSSLEAILYVLEILEPQTPGRPELLACFERMVQRQATMEATHRALRGET